MTGSIWAHGVGRVRKGRRPPRRGFFPDRQLWYAAPAVLFLIAFFGYPMLVLADMSFRKVSLGTAVRGPRPWVGWENYREVLVSADFTAAIPRTFAFVVVVVIAVLLLGLALALTLKENLAGVRIGRFLIFFAWLFPPVVTGAVWRNLFNGTQDGVVNYLLLRLGSIQSPIPFLAEPDVGMVVLTFLTIWTSLPFVVLVLIASLQGVPQELYEAASIDGANPAQRFQAVTLPSILPSFAMVGILECIYVYKAFDLILIMTGGGPGTATSTVPFLAYVKAFRENDFGQGAALGVVGIVVGVAIALPYLLRVRRSELS